MTCGPACDMVLSNRQTGKLNFDTNYITIGSCYDSSLALHCYDLTNKHLLTFLQHDQTTCSKIMTTLKIIVVSFQKQKLSHKKIPQANNMILLLLCC